MPRRRVQRPVETSSRAIMDGPNFSLAWGDRTGTPDLMPDDELITTKQAAAILGVTRISVQRIVRRGLIPAWQNQPGVPGSPLRLSLHYVERLLERPDYQRRRANWERGARGQAREFTEGCEEFNIDPVPVRGITAASARDRGLFVTVRQAAQTLGVHVTAVRHLINSGRLKAERRVQRRSRNGRGELKFGVGSPWWFIKKTDLDALLANPKYIKNHRRWWKSALPEARIARQIKLEEEGIEQFLPQNRRKPCGWTSRANWRDTGWVWGIWPDWELPRIGHDPMSPPAGLLTPDEMKEALVNGPSALEDLLWNEWGCI